MRAGLVSLATLVVAVTLSAVVMAWLGGGTAVVVPTARLVAPVGLVWLVATHLAVRTRRLGPLRLQYVLALAGTVAIALVATLLVAQRMFVSRHDAAVLAAVVAFAAVVGWRTADVLAARASADVERVQRGLAAIAAGDLASRVEPSGADELADLARSSNTAAEALQRARDERDAADRARRNLVAAVSHDLRTPLASLRLLVEGIQDGIVREPAELEAALERMGAHVRALAALVDDLFELARIEAGDVGWAVTRIAVPELVEDAVEAFRPEVERAQLHITGVVEGELRPVVGNPERLMRVLSNLLQNAVRHTPAGGRVTLRAAPSREGVLIEVADDGEGIAGDEAPRVFERFYRGAAGAARADGGAGLGLPICRAIVEAHGGSIWIEPGRQRGTSVRFTLPAAV